MNDHRRALHQLADDPAVQTLTPPGDWPAETWRRFVPRASSSASRSARLEAEMPTTATMAAMPMAMPIAVSRVRPRLPRRPSVPVARASPARSRLGATAVVTGAARRR